MLARLFARRLLLRSLGKRSFVSGGKRLVKSQNVLCRNPHIRTPYSSKPIINGVPLDTIRTVKVMDPRTERKICDVRVCDDADTTQAIEAARKAFDSGSWRDTSVTDRNRILSQIGAKIDSNREYLAMLESYDTGNTLDHSFSCIDACLRWLDSLTSANNTQIAHTSHLMLPPPGVVGVILPWHRTLYDMVRYVSGLVQSGSTCVLKPSLRASLSCLHVTQLCHDAGLPPGVLNVVLGGSGVGKCLVSSQSLDSIVFSGSQRTATNIAAHMAEIGKISKIAKIAQTDEIAENGVMISSKHGNFENKLFLELNEEKRSCLIIHNDIDVSELGSICEFVAETCLLQCGQHVELPKRVFVGHDVYELFLETLGQTVENLIVGDPFFDLEFCEASKCTQQGPMQNEKEFNKVLTLMTEVEQSRGDASYGRSLTRPSKLNSSSNSVVRLVTGGKRVGNSGFFMKPTVLADVTDNMAVAKLGKDVLGPIIQVSRFENVEEVAECVNKNFDSNGAVGVFSESAKEKEKFGEMLQVGNIYFNEFEHALLRKYGDSEKLKRELNAWHNCE